MLKTLLSPTVIINSIVFCCPKYICVGITKWMKWRILISLMQYRTEWHLFFTSNRGGIATGGRVLSIISFQAYFRTSTHLLRK
ncbi:hypothetical protein FKM82_002320 [Ascaphus truei]